MLKRSGDQLGQAARAILANRQLRQTILPAELFGEWPWGALLTLFVADAEGRRLTGHMIAEQLACPKPVMARWIQHLSTTGLVVGDGTGDLNDLLTLSPRAISALETYLAATVETAEMVLRQQTL
ncbi:hypothetical protein M9979_01475 [Sphingomonas sp. RP10(2022)]|uniref:MarR family transcriptional regulator n=1 Tax=Sphingomonas liriopis TaxID=2949094 RepID=A0A9X2KND8_9SPHN|nr:hypothetical protein [Sphingomonas liriopis]MCP3733554.1 hypothetical protein [Sphingomonas liriopis]